MIVALQRIGHPWPTWLKEKCLI